MHNNQEYHWAIWSNSKVIKIVVQYVQMCTETLHLICNGLGTRIPIDTYQLKALHCS